MTAPKSAPESVPEWTQQHADELRDHWWWRPGWHVGTRFYAFHLALDHAEPLHQLVARYQAELQHIDGLDLIPPRWLHLTMQGLGFVHDVTPATRDAAVEAARTALTQLDPIRVHFHRPVIRPEAIALPPQPVQPLQHLRATIRNAIADSLGPDTAEISASRYQPHVSIAYANTDQPAAEVTTALGRVDTEPVQIIIDAVPLIEMHRDNRMYEWQTLTVLPIGTSG